VAVSHDAATPRDADRPEIAWNSVTAEFTGEFAPLSPQQVAAAIVDSARRSDRIIRSLTELLPV